ncbi:MAG: protein adenylyltransferase SelO family protein [Gemmataceae bacterium]
MDRGGRYAYGNQPAIAQWNLARFAETLLPLLDPDQQTSVALATDALGEFPALFEGYWLEGLRQKLGLQTSEAGDVELIGSLLGWMQRARADFTNTFRDLSSEGPPAGDRHRDPDFLAWYSRWQHRLARDGRPKAEAHAAMRTVNPAVIPRNHRVEEALSAAEDHDDLSVLHRLLAALASPYEAGDDSARYRDAPPDDCNYRTFCGT